ncbi:hypothetical protein BSQ40_12130 [Serratia fonticola]|nr:hypothetical protein BSQ40_12130 [Serratia fonticola]
MKAKETKSHELKILPEFFEGVIAGEKKAEVRSTNGIKGCYAVGDELWLREWSLETGYTGRDVYREITHVADLGSFVRGYVLLSMAPY